MGLRLPKELEAKILATPGVVVIGGKVPATTPAGQGRSAADATPARQRGKRKPPVPTLGPLVAGSVHVLWLPGWVPNRLNLKLRRHWSAEGRVKKASKAEIHAAALLCGRPTTERPRKVTLYLLLGAGRKCIDPDAAWKDLLDGLVDAGCLVDDSPAWCRIDGPHYLRCLHGAPSGAFVVLTDL